MPLKYFRRKPREHNHGYSPNLHSVWDSAILDRDTEGADSHEYADRLEETYASSIEGNGKKREFTSMIGCGKATTTPRKTSTPR